MQYSLDYLSPKFELKKLRNSKYNRIIGIDEVGRGCWAGPIYVGAYEFHQNSEILNGVHDSKKLSIKRRNEVYKTLSMHPYQMFKGSVEDISRKGIGHVLKSLIAQIVSNYDDGNTLILIDGYFAFNFGKNVIMLTRGDLNYYSIAAASILAKVERDRLMQELSIEYANYGFDSHKGYGTKKHRQALQEYGVCPIHRRSYKPIKALI